MNNQIISTQNEFDLMRLFWKAFPGGIIVCALWSAAIVEIVPMPARVFLGMTGLVVFVLLVIVYIAEVTMHKAAYNETLQRYRAETDTIRAKNELLVQPPIVLPTSQPRDIPVSAQSNAQEVVNGYTRAEWQYIVHRCLIEGHTKQLWLGHTLPSEKEIGSHDTWSAMLKPFVDRGVLVGQQPRVSGTFAIRDESALVAIAMTPLLSPEDERINLVFTNRPDQKPDQKPG